MSPALLAALVFGGLQGGSALLDYLTGSKKLGTERMALGLQKKQVEAAAGMGRREEHRTDKLTKQLLEHEDKLSRRSESRMERADLRGSQEQENQMMMSMIMALSGMNQQATNVASQPPPSRMSMMGLMR